jgi:transposase
MTRSRRMFSAAQKAEIVRKHLVEKVPVSTLADQYQVQPTLIHSWVKIGLSQLERAYESRAKSIQPDRRDREIALLKEKLAAKNEVISELMEENVLAKKELGEP